MHFNLILKYNKGIFRILSLIFCLLLAESINAQAPISDSLKLNFKEGVLNPITDTTTQRTAHAQSLDSLKANATDTLDIPKSDIETRIFYTCRDSLRMNIAEQKVYLYGDAKVTYGSRILTAEFMEINWATNEVNAYGLVDSLKGKTIGKPVFKEGSDMYVAETIRYNMKSGKGIISGIVTRQGDGYIQGGPVKKTPEAIYVKHAIYTTCNLPHPHFSINASKLKVIPGDKVVTGPFHMEIMGIPTPLGLPLGFFPVTRRSKSGIIFPTIGEQRSRGFFISNGGYYWAVNDYVGVKVLGDLYANKSYRLATTASYIKRYAYTGTSSMSYSKVKEGFVDTVKAPLLFNLRWNHATLGNKSSRLSADVNISSSKFYATNSYNPASYQAPEFASNISWSKAFRNSPFSMSVAFRQNQNTVNKTMNITAPDVNFSMNRIYPFKGKNSDGTKWFEKINIAYNGSTKYIITNQLRNAFLGNTFYSDTIVSFDNNFQDIVNNAQWGLQNTIPINTTFKVFKYFSLNPSVRITNWVYANKLDYTTTVVNGVVQTKQAEQSIEGLNTAFSGDFSTTLTTRIYGLYRLNNKILQGIRHTFIPNFTYTYRPDLVGLDKGNKYFYTNSSDVSRTTGEPIPYSRYQGYIYGGPGSGTVNSLSFSFVNSLEGKARNRKDTTGLTPTKKIKLLDNVNAAGSYNFGADSMQWSLITWGAQTNLFERININFNGTFDPYIYILDSVSSTNSKRIYQHRINTLASERTAENPNPKFLILTNYNVAISTNLNPKGQKTTQPANQMNMPSPNGYTLIGGAQYVDFNIPWNLMLGYNLSYSKQGYDTAVYSQAFTFSGDVKVSDNWKVKFTSGYDFVRKSIAYNTRIEIFRDLHCWQMSMSVIPFGQQQSFFFTLNAKSSLLRDMKLTKRDANNLGTGY